MAHNLVPVGSEFRVNTYTNLSQYNPSLTALADGGFMASWTSSWQDGDQTGVYAQRYNAQGQAVGGEFRVNTYTTDIQDMPSLTALANGGFVASWTSYKQDDGNNYGIYAQRYNAQGQAVGSEFRVNTYISDSQYAPVLTALSDGGFVASWMTDGQDGHIAGVFAKRYNAQGQAVGGEFQVNTYYLYDQSYPCLTTLSDGGFVASWMSNGQDGSTYGIYAQRYNAQVQKVGGEFRVNTYTTGSQEMPSLTALSDGGFVVVWQSYLQDGSGYGVYAQRYNAQSQVVGSEFRINTLTTGDQMLPSLAALSDGGFVASWQSINQDGSGYGVYAQRYNAQGQAVGSEFLINTYATGDQMLPSLAALSDGSFVASWQSAGQDGSSFGVYAQRYGLSNTSPQGTANAVLANGSEDAAYTVTLAQLTAGLSDADGDTLSVSGVTSNHGAVTNNGNGTWTLAPTGNYNGVVTFSYTVSDGYGGSLAASLGMTLSSVNDVPTGSPSSTLAGGTEDIPYTVTLAQLTAGFSDIDGDTLGVSGLGSNHGTVTNNGNGTWTFTPTANYYGAVQLSYSVVDGHGGSVAASLGLTLAAVNDAPAGVASASLASGAEDTAYTFTAAQLLAGFGDVDGDSLSVSGLTANHGSLVNNGNGTWTFTPAADYHGPVTLNYSVVDGRGGSVATNLGFNLAAANDTPTGTATTVLANGTEDTGYTLTLAQLTAGFSDLDGDTLGVANLSADHGTVTDNGDGTWTVTSDAHYYGAVQLDYDVVDGQGENVAGSLGFTLNGVIDSFNLTGGDTDDIFHGDDLNPGATDTLSGLGGNDQLYGHGGNDQLRGGAGTDLLDGGEGTDYMAGGEGNDTYVVDNINDVVDEPLSGGGIDTLISLLPSYTLRYAAMENLVLGTGGLNGNGNWINNVITGNEQNNVLHGYGGNDMLLGLGGNDELWGDDGADAMAGGQGDDRYFIDNTGDSVTENADEGLDTVSSSVNHALGANFENLLLTGAAANGAGNELDNLITGNNVANILMGQGGNDTLDGKAGADQMAGGQGNDFYYVDNTADAVTENVDEGIDTIQAQLISYSLSANVENLILTGWNVNGSGNALNNSLTGSQGNNVLDGGLGMDLMAGGKGDDTYIVDNAGDGVTELAGEGSDTIQSSVSYGLSANVEKLTLTGSADLEAWGNGLNNVLTGNSGANVLMGGLGSDTLNGGNGDDTLLGEEGSDRLTGGAGADWFGLTGALGTGADTITDFQAGTDLIVLDGNVFTALGASIDAGEFRVSPWSAKAMDANDFLLFVPSFGGLFYDADGNGAGAAVQIANLSGISSLDASNLFLYFPPSP